MGRIKFIERKDMYRNCDSTSVAIVPSEIVMIVISELEPAVLENLMSSFQYIFQLQSV